LVRSADPTRPDFQRSLWSGPFAPQLASGRVHPQLAPLTHVNGGYALDASAAPNWFELRPGRGFAGYGLSRALRMLLDVLGGLAALHDTPTESGEGFVHGEVVPDLMRVDRAGVVRLLPLAPWHWQAVPESPARERVGHLAPERLLGDAMDRRADVFSAGVLLWEALAGRRLFEHDSPDQVVTRLFGGRVQLPALPPELAWAKPLEAVALRAMSVDPEQRFVDCAELAQAIETAGRGHVAAHADVAAYFAVPQPHVNPVMSRLPPPPRLPTPEAFRSPHKSSLSALVAPTPAPSDLEVEHELRAPAQRTRRSAWTATVLVALSIGLGLAAFTQRKQLRASIAPAAPVLTAAAASVPVAATQPVAAPVVAAPAEPSAATSVAREPAPEVTPTRVAPARDAKARLPLKPAKPPPPAPAKAPRVHDNEAEQYGI